MLRIEQPIGRLRNRVPDQPRGGRVAAPGWRGDCIEEHRQPRHGLGWLARAGAVPVRMGHTLIGAIGVGGARGSDKDEACAVAGLDKVRSRLH